VHDRAWTPGRRVRIEPAALGDDAPLYGAILLLGLACVRLGYEQRPVVPVGREDEVRSGWAEVGATIAADARRGDRCVVAVECYPGVHSGEVRDALAAALAPAKVVAAEDALLSPGDLSRDLAAYLGDDPVFAG